MAATDDAFSKTFECAWVDFMVVTFEDVDARPLKFGPVGLPRRIDLAQARYAAGDEFRHAERLSSRETNSASCGVPGPILRSCA